jgi:hypothetical protein
MLDAGLAKVEIAESAAPRRPAGALPALAAVVALSLPLMYFSVFTGLAHFDDEGTLLVGFQSILDGRRMYDDIYSLYGPFYNLAYAFIYDVVGVPLTHSNGRTIALALWVAFCSGFALFLQRLTRSIALMAAAFVLLVIMSRPLANSPGHPEEISLALVATALLCASALDQQARPWILAILATALASLALIKINFGIYVGSALVFALLCATRPAWWTRLAVAALACAMVALPFVVESFLLAFDWVRYSIVSSTCTIAAVLIMALATRPAPRLTGRDWAIFVATGLAAGIVIVGLMILDGSSPYAILNAVILQNFTFAKNWYIGTPVGFRGAAISILSVCACLFTRFARTDDRLSPHTDTLLTVASTIFVVSTLVSVAHAGRIIIVLTPFCWLGLVRAPASIGRTALCLLAATMSLYPFPVAGHQLNIAALPTLLVALLVLHDLAARDLPAWLSPGPARVAGGAALAALLGFFTIRSAGDYASAAPLQLPGTEHIRVPADRLADIRWANAALRSCRTSYTLPGQFSYGLWAKHRLVTDLNVNHQLAFLSWEQQQRIVDAMAREPDLCVLYDPTLLRFFDRGQIRTNPPLVRYILANGVEEDRRGNLILLRIRR